ncbi:MAG: hypothetical protein PHT00_04340, partial [Candidatus Methanomethylophilus sp.]|nr:hypothetical protein [Methanomethylophilus sp.]MDD3233379.1 hypothetical protein [Methanomethylophilus sp.]
QVQVAGQFCTVNHSQNPPPGLLAADTVSIKPVVRQQAGFRWQGKEDADRAVGGSVESVGTDGADRDAVSGHVIDGTEVV